MKVQKKVFTATITTTSVELGNDVQADATIKRFAEVKAVIKALSDEQKMLDAEIRAMLGDASVATINGVVRAEIKSRTRKGVNTDDLKEVFPEAYELCMKETDYTILLAE